MKPRVHSLPLVEALKPRLRPADYNLLVQATASDYATLARMFGVPVGTLKSKLNRARNRFDVIFAKEVHPNGAPKWGPDRSPLNEAGELISADTRASAS